MSGSLISNKWILAGNSSRHLLVLLMFTCAVLLLVENSLMQNIYTVYVHKAIDYNRTAPARDILISKTKERASRKVKGLKHIQVEHVDVNITDNQKDLNASYLSKENTALLNVFNQTKSANDSAEKVQVEHVELNIADYEKDLNTSYLFAENTVLLTVFDKIKSENDSAKPIAKAQKFNKTEHLHVQLPESFEIRHDWPIHKSGTLDIFILSAVGANATAAKGYYKEIELNGWQARKHKYAAIKCCILWNSHKISEYYYPRKTHQKKKLSLLGSQIACPIKDPLQDVNGVTIQFAKKLCPKNKKEYIRPLIPRAPVKNDTMAICLKILYGDIDPLALIYWIEYYIEMKVDKIFTFTYKVANSIENILRHYYNLGVVDWREYDFPWKGGRDVGKKVPVFWEDEQVVIYDSFSRLHGYTYFGIIDMDEYLLPRKHKNIKHLMKYLLEKYPKGAGFTMKSYLFNKNWEISGTENGTDTEKYIRRTRAFTGAGSRQKSILLPSRIEFDSNFHTHRYTPRKGYKSVIVDETIASINHYRKCYTELKRPCARARAVTDRHILKVIRNIKTRTEWFSKLRDKGRLI